SKNGIPENLQFSSEQYGFLKRAFDDYAEIRRISLSLKDLSPPEQKKQKAIQEALLLDANFAIAYYEQAFKIQPHYSKIKSEIDILNGQMSLIDPRGKFKLLRNFPTKAEDRKPEDSWTVLTTRLGLEPKLTSDNPAEVIKLKVFPILRKDNPRYDGTIADYVISTMADKPHYPKIREAPPKLK
nr:hypothetical protein [Pseudomonadota bacterium]